MCHTVAMLKSAFWVMPILLLLSAGVRAQNATVTLLSDNFTKDTALNTTLWSIGTPLMNALAQQSTNSTLLTPQLSFSQSGMTMQATENIWQYTGIQSNQSFTAPFSAQVTVMGTVSDANTFLFELTTADLSHFIDLRGNLNPSNLPYYGMNLLSNVDTAGAFLYNTPSLNVFYTISYTVTAAGMATVVLTDPNGNILGMQSNINIGTGPFYAVLGQFEGTPVTVGPNIAVWQQVQVTGPATPSVLANGVVSAGAFGSFPAVSPGSWIEIYGNNLAADARPWASSDFVGITAPTSLDDTSVTVGGKSAFLDYISPGQVNALISSDTPTGMQQLIVTNGLGPGTPYSIMVNSVEPGLLAPAAFLVGGIQYAVGVLDDGAYAMPAGAIAQVNSRPAKPGETIIFYGVGFGLVTPASPAGQIVQQANTLSSNFQISIGGQAATWQYAGLAPGFTGLYQFNVTVPAATAGAAPVVFGLGGAAGTQKLYIAVGN
jgi:uncharacterized protein (TIGR03437 family)